MGKQNRYNTFRASCNPVPLKCSFRRHLKAISKPKFHVTTQYLPTSVSQWIGKDGSASRLNKMEIIFMKCTETTLFSAKQGDSSLEDEDLQAKEINEANMYSEIEYYEEVVCSTGLMIVILFVLLLYLCFKYKKQ